jgi:hypothetical protein
MATSTLQTDFLEQSPNPQATLFTNLWHFSPVGVAGQLPDYNHSLVSCVTRVQQDLGFTQFVMGGVGGVNENEYALFKKDEVYTATQIWRSPVYKVGQDFDVVKISFNLVTALTGGTSITPKLYFDNERESAVGTVINMNNFSQKYIELRTANFQGAVHGQHSFFLELQFTGSALTVISLPLFVEIDTWDI